MLFVEKYKMYWNVSSIFTKSGWTLFKPITSTSCQHFNNRLCSRLEYLNHPLKPTQDHEL